jgi:hypothetical protein
VVDRIKADELDPYKALEKYLVPADRGLTPKTIRGYLTATRGLLRNEGKDIRNFLIQRYLRKPKR